MKNTRSLIFALVLGLLFLAPSLVSATGCVDTGYCLINSSPATCSGHAGCAYVNPVCYTSSPCASRTQAACTGPHCNWVVTGTLDNTSETTGTLDNTNSRVSLDNPLGSVTTPQVLIGKIINSILGVVGSLALLMFIFGGLTWMTSGGSADKVKKGKDIIVWSAIGLVVIFASYGLVRFLILNIK